jgi:SAM-dependent methyltransferase
MTMRFQRSLWPVLALVIVTCLSTPGYSQKPFPDVHFDPTPDDVVEAMLKMAGVTGEDVVYDLGCGDGRFVITAARKFGARGVGVDIDPVRIDESNQNARKAGVTDRVQFIEGDLFKTDIRGATVITLYLLNELNQQLRPRLLRDLKPGTRIVSHTFDMGDWEPDEIGKVRNRMFYYWVVPAQVAGAWRLNLASSRTAWLDQLTLDQEFQEIRGKASVDGWQLRIREPRLRGHQLSFRVRYNFEGQDVAMQFKGRVNDDTMTGTVEIQGGPATGTHPWTATRVRN